MNKTTTKTGLIIAAALFAGLAVGAYAAPGAAAPDPVALAPQIRTVTPTECLQALDAADELIGTGSEALAVSSDVLGLMPAALDAAMTWDAEALDDIAGQIGDKNSDMKQLNDLVDVQGAEYTDAAAACRAAR